MGFNSGLKGLTKLHLRIKHDNAEHKGTVESHNIVVNKTRILLFYCIIFTTELTDVVLHGYFYLLYH